MEKEHILEEAGLTKGEVKVYLALLELGETTSGPIIDMSGISSSKVYEIIEKLIQKGLASYIIKGEVKYFQPASPEKIRDYIDAKKKILNETGKEIEKIIPELKRKQKLSEDMQTSSIYEGFEGIKTVFNRILDSQKKGEEYYVFTLDEETSSPQLREFLLNYHTKRVDRGIKVKLLSNSKFKNEIKKKYPHYKLSERRFVERAFPTGIFILKNMVIHFIYNPKPTIFVITSRQNYESYKRFFLDLWKDAKD